MIWSRDGLAELGFTGLVSFATLHAIDVPTESGVYMVLRPDEEPPVFRAKSSAGWFKKKDPSVDIAKLGSAWLSNASVLYIGKAAAGMHGKRGIRKRLREYRRHGEGAAVGHWGGRYIWQLAQSERLLVAWMRTPGVGPESVESQLISEFERTFGARPFANRKAGRTFAATIE